MEKKWYFISLTLIVMQPKTAINQRPPAKVLDSIIVESRPNELMDSIKYRLSKKYKTDKVEDNMFTINNIVPL